MSTTRTEKTQGCDPYTRISNALIVDKRLSASARLILVYLLSRPDNWVPRMSDLMSVGNMGRDAVRAILAELVATGYLNKSQRRQSNGWVGQNEYEIYESPRLNPQAKALINESSTVEPLTDFPSTDYSSSINHRLITNKKRITTDQKNKLLPPPPPGPGAHENQNSKNGGGGVFSPHREIGFSGSRNFSSNEQGEPVAVVSPGPAFPAARAEIRPELTAPRLEATPEAPKMQGEPVAVVSPGPAFPAARAEIRPELTAPILEATPEAPKMQGKPVKAVYSGPRFPAARAEIRPEKPKFVPLTPENAQKQAIFGFAGGIARLTEAEFAMPASTLLAWAWMARVDQPGKDPAAVIKSSWLASPPPAKYLPLAQWWVRASDEDRLTALLDYRDITPRKGAEIGLKPAMLDVLGKIAYVLGDEIAPSWLMPEIPKAEIPEEIDYDSGYDRRGYEEPEIPPAPTYNPIVSWKFVETFPTTVQDALRAAFEGGVIEFFSSSGVRAKKSIDSWLLAEISQMKMENSQRPIGITLV